VLEAVDVPVLAAGGIGSGRALAEALAAGASGVRVGTRFVAAQKSDAHPEYGNQLTAARAEDTIYTQAFSQLRGSLQPRRPTAGQLQRGPDG
jgi:NAD(P)H-dependent flavin oxidoreductase YrpB (nitropropane dioxygenase family)